MPLDRGLGEVGSARTSGASAPASVNTVRLWTGSVCRSRSATGSASDEPRICRDRLGFGAARRRWARRAASAAIERAQSRISPSRRISVPSMLTTGSHHDAVEVHGHLDRPSDRLRGAEGDVGGAEELLVLEHVAGQHGALVGADAELGDRRSLLAVRAQELQQGRALAARCLGQAAAADGHPHRLVRDPDPGDRPVDDQRPLAAAVVGRDEALAAGEVAQGHALGELARVRDRRPRPPGSSGGRCRWRR